MNGRKLFQKRLRQNFVWTGRIRKECCVPHEEGGSGVRSLFAVNKAYNWVYVYLKVAWVCESFLDPFTFATFYTIQFHP